MCAGLRVRLALTGDLELLPGVGVELFQIAPIVARHGRDLREERPGRLPTFGAAADMVVGALAVDRHGNLLVGTTAE